MHRKYEKFRTQLRRTHFWNSSPLFNTRNPLVDPRATKLF
ncbi:hypothetical protein V6Z12_D12G181300 [Gossypium hirsutum]